MKWIDLLLPFIMALLQRLQQNQPMAAGPGAKAPKKFTRAEVKAAMQDLMKEGGAG